MQRLVALGLMALAACAKPKPTPAEMAKASSDAYVHYTRDVEAIGTSLGAARFEPEHEVRSGTGRAPVSREGLVTHAGLTFRVEGGRVGHSLIIGTDCSGQAVNPTYFYTRRGAGVAIVVVNPDIHVKHVHLKGSCGMSGCGTEPPPPPELLWWLPVSQVGAITVEMKTVRLERTRITCDRPNHPP